MTDEFWKIKKIKEYTTEEWEALCDHCGICCLHKIEDTESGIVYTTYVACKFLDINTCSCKEYVNRQSAQPECICLTSETIDAYTWLPETCSYRLMFLGKVLPDWHPLKTGNPDSTALYQKSVTHFAIPDENIDSLENYIILENGSSIE